MKARTLLHLAVGLSLFGAPLVARADGVCGGVKLQAGQIVVGKPLSEAWLQSAEGKACAHEIAEAVDRHRLARAVTVAALVSDADRASGKAIASARAIAKVLVDAGLPKARVFALAPALPPEGSPGLSLRYVERAPEDVVARVAAVGGASFLGADEPALRPAEPGMPVLVNELLKTGPSAKIAVHLKDGSGIDVLAESLVRMKALELPPGGDRKVQVEVLRGRIVADVRKATQLSRFEASSRVAVAAVRGTEFRFGVDESGQSRLETLAGVVALGPVSGGPAVDVPAGQGALVGADGKVVGPRPLPAAPSVVAPQTGPLGAEARLSWTPVPDAASYFVEVARDADFVVEARSVRALDASVSWPEPLATGKWFWRVTATSSDGYSGRESKVYAFTVGAGGGKKGAR